MSIGCDVSFRCSRLDDVAESPWYFLFWPARRQRIEQAFKNSFFFFFASSVIDMWQEGKENS